MMIKNYFLTVFLSLFFYCVQAQDAHFSQYYTFAQSLNPALTANYNGSYKVSIIYRNQWSSFLNKAGYNTPGASLDLSLLEGKLNGDKFGLGLMFFHDRFGEGALSTLNAALSLAYHKGIGRNKNHRFSLGAQVAYVQKDVDSDGLTFYDQFDVVSHSGKGQSSDVLTMNRGSYYFFDYNFGLYWKSNFADRVKLQTGFALSHVSQPTEYFVSETKDYFLARKYTADLGLEIFILKNKLSISPDVLFQMQGKAQEIVTGAFVSYYFNDGFRKKTSLHLGARYRLNDAVAPMAQVEFRNIRLGVAYDVNISPLKTSSKYGGGFEVSLSYMGESIKAFKANKSLPARRF